ncbi:MAG TPA: B12-binding domain-containing radical SAM protein [Phycisphaerales bacterium]|nr:B12-binding domain-containing radical SAM protein [Phycisphaerales bacterium]
MRILLVQPEYLSEGIGFRLAAMPEPLHLEMAAAVVPDHELRILDMRLDGGLNRALREFQPDLVAVTALTVEVYSARDVARQVKAHSADIFTVVGGHHATLMPEDFYIPEVNAVALGEAEIVFPALIGAVADGRGLKSVPNLIWQDADGRFVRNAESRDKVDMDSLPIPRRDLTADYRDEYFFLFDKPDTSVATGRGCPYRCNFCSVWQFYRGRTAQMSPERVLTELKFVGTDHVTFVDDNFLMNNRRENAIADLIRAEGIQMRFSMECRTDSIARHPELVEKWRDIGLYAVLLGLEGASDKTLKSVNKSNTAKINDEALRVLRDNGIIIWGAFIVDPDWTEDDFKQLRDYVNRQEITHTQFTILTPLPGTVLYREKFADLLTYDYLCFDTMHAVLPTRLPRDVFYQQFANLYRQTDLGPYYDLVREGKLTIDDVKRGKGMLDAMTHWERFLDKDPVLGRCRDKSEALPGALNAGRALPATK